MKSLHYFLLATIVCSSCNCNEPAEEGDVEKDISALAKDTSARVTGIGGIFFGSSDPRASRDWYGRNLGMAIDSFGSPFEFRNSNRPDEINYLRWSPYKEGSPYYSTGEKELMINYRVQNLEGLRRQLLANGVTILDTIATYDYGKFLHILDPDGYKVELWEPVDSVLTKMGGRTTK
jgi:catechol 2,3-dioxygenase-like lactoylglutathione lyase family enzyme